MKRLARNMRPPKTLALELSTRCPVFLIWGKGEVFYPGFLAKSMEATFNTRVLWSEGGHYCMWSYPEGFHRHMLSIEQQLSGESFA